MKKRNKEFENKLVILTYFAAAYISLNLFNSLTSNILGITFIIAGVYGIVLTSKKKKFVF